jgi:hypothetical protein
LTLKPLKPAVRAPLAAVASRTTRKLKLPPLKRLLLRLPPKRHKYF